MKLGDFDARPQQIDTSIGCIDRDDVNTAAELLEKIHNIVGERDPAKVNLSFYGYEGDHQIEFEESRTETPAEVAARRTKFIADAKRNAHLRVGEAERYEQIAREYRAKSATELEQLSKEST